jgi:hypothetical protein
MDLLDKFTVATTSWLWDVWCQAVLIKDRLDVFRLRLICKTKGHKWHGALCYRCFKTKKELRQQ